VRWTDVASRLCLVNDVRLREKRNHGLIALLAGEPLQAAFTSSRANTSRCRSNLVALLSGSAQSSLVAPDSPGSSRVEAVKCLQRRRVEDGCG